MKPPKPFSGKMPLRTSRILYRFARLGFLVGILLIAVFFYLRLHGVPKPVLYELVSRANRQGIPVKVDKLKLTILGWRAENIRYFSHHPDDLKPLFEAEYIYFKRRHAKEANARRFDVDARQVCINPSVEWRVEFPRTHDWRNIERISGGITFSPDRIEVERGRLNWKGLRFYVAGTILRNKNGRRLFDKWSGDEKDMLLNAAQFQKIDRQLEQLDMPGDARIGIDFLLNTENLTASYGSLTAGADEVVYRETRFNHVEMVLAYEHPRLKLTRSTLSIGNDALELAGEYDFTNRQLKGRLLNTIRSGELRQLFPAGIDEALERWNVELSGLPRAELTFGPTVWSNLLYTVNGSFAFDHAAYQGVEVQSLRGRVESRPHRIDLTELQAVVIGRQDQAQQVGSALEGGQAGGTVFWDGGESTFGVEASTGFDPRLLVEPLAFCRVATNIIERFSFKGPPPTLQLKLGACVRDWSTFSIEVQGRGEDLWFQGVPFTLVNTSVVYHNRILRLDPLMAMQGERMTKGQATVDFGSKVASFDVVSGMHLQHWEDVIYPGLGVFGRYIRTSGNVNMTARGSFDWGRMEATDFTADLKADGFVIDRIAASDAFSATLSGKGSGLSISNAVFNLYGGEGTGKFSMNWSPQEDPIPYQVEANLSGVEFREFTQVCAGGRPVNVSGKMWSEVEVASDFSTNFYATAKGQGSILVKKGKLADLPLFSGFSRLMRKVFPGFKVFSISRLQGNASIGNGAIVSSDAYFEGNLLNAKAKGKYDPDTGFDAKLEVQVFRDSGLGKVVRVITDPLLRLLDLHLTGTFAEPSWKLENF